MYIFIIFSASHISITAQRLSVFDVDASRFRTISAHFYAFDANYNKVTNFSVDDFKVVENGKDREAAFVSCPKPQQEHPVSLAISIDVSASMTGEPLQFGKLTAYNLVKSFFHPQSEIALQVCDDTPVILQDFTSDFVAVLNAIDSIKVGLRNNFVIQLLNKQAGILNIAKTGKNKRNVLLNIVGVFVMPKVFSVASWNVEHFKNSSASDAARVQRVAKFISGNDGGPATIPEIFVLYEVEGKDIFWDFMKEFPDHRFHLTEGKQTQEIFVGVHKKFQTFTTQRLEYKTGREYQRPGLLLTLQVNNINYSLLFLHIKSGDNTEDFGLRDAALIHAFNLKKTLDNISGGNANFIFLGDLNTMGIDDPVPYLKTMDLTSDEEIARIKYWAQKRNMVLLTKDQTTINGVNKEVTWYNGSSDYKPTNLDHVVASNHLQIRSQGNGPYNVSIFGWPKLAASNWNNWFTKYSDHALLYFEVWS